MTIYLLLRQEDLQIIARLIVITFPRRKSHFLPKLLAEVIKVCHGDHAIVQQMQHVQIHIASAHARNYADTPFVRFHASIQFPELIRCAAGACEQGNIFSIQLFYIAFLPNLQTGF